MTPAQHTGKRWTKKEKPHEYKGIPFFPEHPKTAVSGNVLGKKIKLQEDFQWEKGSNMCRLVGNTVRFF